MGYLDTNANREEGQTVKRAGEVEQGWERRPASSDRITEWEEVEGNSWFQTPGLRTQKASLW